MRQDVLVGSVTILFCVLIAVRERWFLEATTKGQRLVRCFGPERALWVLRGLTAFGILFGASLAAGVIHPIRW